MRWYALGWQLVSVLVKQSHWGMIRQLFGCHMARKLPTISLQFASPIDIAMIFSALTGTLITQ